MSSLLTGREITLTSIGDLTPGLSVENLLNLKVAYATAIDNSHDEHIARGGVFHPSSVGYCKKQNVLQRLGVKPTDRRSKDFGEIVALGHAIHEIVQSRLEALRKTLEPHGIKCEFTREVPCDRESDELFLSLGIAGTCDGILRLWTKTWEQRGVVEIKSSNTDLFKEREMAKKADAEHLMQAHLYAYRFDCPVIWIWYYNKNNSKRELMPYFFDRNIYLAAVDYFIELDSYVQDGTLPEREESWFECKECPYRTMCDPNVLKSRKQYALPTKTLRRK
jgi:CRISPR/Cas system-associated exonuclease Cas4 (RecB family)